MNYYLNQNKKKRKEIVQKLKKDDNKNTIYKKAKRILFISVLGIIYGILVTILDIIMKASVYNYVLDGLLVAFCLIFIIRMNTMRIIELNRYALSLKKQK